MRDRYRHRAPLIARERLCAYGEDENREANPIVEVIREMIDKQSLCWSMILVMKFDLRAGASKINAELACPAHNLEEANDFDHGRLRRVTSTSMPVIACPDMSSLLAS